MTLDTGVLPELIAMQFLSSDLHKAFYPAKEKNYFSFISDKMDPFHFQFYAFSMFIV